MLFRAKRHPEERGAVAGEAFLTALAVMSNVASSTQNHAPNGIVFLYRQTVREGFGWLEGMKRANEPAGLPVVFTRYEERAVLARLNSARSVMASRLYGSGLRLMEYAGAASGTSIRIDTPFSDSGLDYKLP